MMTRGCLIIFASEWESMYSPSLEMALDSVTFYVENLGYLPYFIIFQP